MRHLQLSVVPLVQADDFFHWHAIIDMPSTPSVSMNDLRALPGKVATLIEASVSRAEMESLLARHAEPLVFEACHFDGEDLSGLDLHGAEFRQCSMVETNWLGAKLGETRWLRCRGRQADFQSAALVDAQFHNCDLNNTEWRRAKLSSTLFQGCKLTGASFVEVSALGCRFTETLMIGADLRGMSFRKVHLDQLDFSDADLSGCDFREAVFMGGSLRNAHVKLAQFQKADLRDADIGGLQLFDAELFRGALISHSQAAALLAAWGLIVA